MDVALGTVLVFLYRVLGMFFLVLVSVITARALSVEDRGVFQATIVTISAIGSLVASFAAATGYYVSHQRREPAEVAANATILSAALGLAVLILCGSAWAVLKPGLLPGIEDVSLLDRASRERHIILLIGISLFPMVARHALGGVALGLHQQARYSFSIYGPAYATVIFFVVWLAWFDERSATLAITLWIASQYASLLAQALFGWSWWGWLFSHRPDRQLIRQFATFGTITGLAGFASFLNYRIDQLLVFAIAGDRDTGIYAAAVQFAEGLWLFSTTLAVSAFASVGSLGRADSAALTATSTRHTLLVSVVTGAIIFAFAPYLIEGVFGERYVDATLALRVLTVGTVLWAPAAVLSNYFSIQLGRPIIPLALATLSCVINVAVSVVLIPRFGFNGAAWGTTASYSVTILITAFVFVRLSGVRFSDLWRIRIDDLASYVRLARRIMHGELFRHLIPSGKPVL